MRAGEFEVVSAVSGGRTRTISTVLQALRTEEWRLKMHHTLMYGTVHEIYHAGFLPAVQASIVDSRYQGRLTFGWITNVIRSPATERFAVVPWPIIYVHGSGFVLVWQGRHARRERFDEVYELWRDVCVEMGGIIAGRYDVRKCTI